MQAKRGNTAGSPPSDAGRRIGGQRRQPVVGQFEYPIRLGSGRGVSGSDTLNIEHSTYRRVRPERKLQFMESGVQEGRHPLGCSHMIIRRRPLLLN